MSYCRRLIRALRNPFAHAMKILVYSMNFWPEPTSTGKYSGEMVAWLASRGHQVRAIAAPPYYPEWKVADGYSRFRYRRDDLNGADVRRCPVWIPRQPSGLKRIICMLLFGLTSSWEAFRALFWRPDIVIVVEPPISCAPVAWLFARLGGAKTWLHVQDFEVDAALQLGMLRLGVLRRVALCIDRLITRRFDRRSTISQRMMDRLTEKSGTAEGNVLFPNWVDCEQIFPLPTSVFREELHLRSDQKVALYAGNIGRKQGLEIVIEAAQRLQHDDSIVFVICGHGAAYEEIRSLGDGLSNVRWLPVQPMDKLNDLLALADVHLLPQKAGAADLVMPSKLTGMLASGRAVLATADEGTQVFDVVSEVGRVVPPEKPEPFVHALIAMLSADCELKEAGRRARQIAVDTLGFDGILGRFEAELKQLCERTQNIVPADSQPARDAAEPRSSVS